ncbi:YbjQ family protein [Alphaproteobacteria bacterium]|nr:YbjQ family protein [Alphaproteobacteria bacterium]
MAECAECNRVVGDWLEAVEFIEGFTLCAPCGKRKKVVEKHRQFHSITIPIPEVTLTTETFLGDAVIRRLGVIASECVLGVNVFRDLKSAITNITGGRSKGLQESLKEAKAIVFDELKIEAHKLGANAVIGIDLDYQELNGKGGDMLMLVASGTAVILNESQAS